MKRRGSSRMISRFFSILPRSTFTGLLIAALAPIILIAGSAVGQPELSGWHSMVFRADTPGIDVNPLRGLVPFAAARPKANGVPYSMEWFTLPLSAVVKGPDTYDWSALERQLTPVAERGNQAIFRFYLDNPKLPTGIPRYLLNAGLKTFSYDDEGNATAATPSVAPDYGDPRLIQCLTHFISAFGSKYDGDPRIAYLTAGLYGFWGEWHVLRHPLPGEPSGWAISTANKDALLQAYAHAFQKTPVLVRTAEVTKDRELLSHFGFHDDSFLYDTAGLGSARFWPVIQRAGAAENWQRHPMGGEIFPPLQNALWSSWPNTRGQDWATTINLTHATFLFDSALFSAVPTSTELANALRAQRMMGYTLFCNSARVARLENGQVSVTARIENRGVAPTYYSWPVEIQALNDQAKVIGAARADWPLSTLLPGASAEWSVTLHSVPVRAKTFVLQIANPMPGGHPITFANAEMNTVKPGWLTLTSSSN